MELEKDLEILVLRQQLGIAERTLQKPIRVYRAERLTLAVAVNKLRSTAGCTAIQRGQFMRLFQPETVLAWHRQLVRRNSVNSRAGYLTHPPVFSRLIKVDQTEICGYASAN